MFEYNYANSKLIYSHYKVNRARSKGYDYDTVTYVWLSQVTTVLIISLVLSSQFAFIMNISAALNIILENHQLSSIP